MKQLYLIFIILCLCGKTYAQNPAPPKLQERLDEYFRTYKAKNIDLIRQPKLLSAAVHDSTKTLHITADETFSMQTLSSEAVKDIYKKREMMQYKFFVK